MKDLKDRTVIIVDDNQVDREILKACCTNLRLRVLAIENSADAALAKLNKFAEQNVVPDLMLLDIMMMGMDGFSLAEEIRSDARFNSSKLIAITSDETAVKVIQNIKTGFNAVLPKPVSPIILQESIQKVLL
jgi:CheY-like chemotaxis protein